jgi:hypothetical protein
MKFERSGLCFCLCFFSFVSQALANNNSENIYKTTGQNSEIKTGLFPLNKDREQELQQTPLLDFHGVGQRPRISDRKELVVTKGKTKISKTRKNTAEYYNVVKSKSGNLNFSPLSGHGMSFSIQPSGKHYAAALKHVGKIATGENKRVPRLPFDLELDESVWIVD